MPKNPVQPDARYVTYPSEGIPLRSPCQIFASCGGINIRKLITSLGKHDGSTNLDMLKEFIDNSLDWSSNNVTITFDSSNFQIIIKDDGVGMNKDTFQKFCEFCGLPLSLF